MKTLRNLAGLILVASLLACSFTLVGISSCEQKADDAVGVSKDPTTGKVVQAPIASTPAGKAVAVADTVASVVAPQLAPIIQTGANILLTGVAGVLAWLLKKKTGEATTAQVALGMANTAISATTAGIQQAVNTLPADHAATFAKILDVAHDAAGVVGALQDQIQPDLSTAGTHAPVIGGASGPLPPKPTT